MREKDINAKIAEYFTPVGFWDTHCRRCHWTFRADGEGCRPDGYCSFVGELPQTADYFTSEDANARLLEAMPFAALYHVAKEHWVCRSSEWIGDVGHADRKTAVVLAFCKFAKIEATV